MQCQQWKSQELSGKLDGIPPVQSSTVVQSFPATGESEDGREGIFRALKLAMQGKDLKGKLMQEMGETLAVENVHFHIIHLCNLYPRNEKMKLTKHVMLNNHG